MVRRKKSTGWFSGLSFPQKSGVVGIIFVLVFITLYATVFSVVGVDEPYVMTFVDGGGSYVYNLSLAANRSVGSAFLTFGFDSVAGSDEFEVPLTILSEKTVDDEDDDDDENERAYVGLYKLDVPDVYDFRIEARSSGAVKVGDDGDQARVDFMLQYINKEYPWDYIQYCDDDDRDDCDNYDELILYVDERSNGDDRYNILDDLSFLDGDSRVRLIIEDDEPSVTGDIFAEGFISHDIYSRYDDFAFLVVPWYFERSASASVVHPAVVTAFYHKSVFPSDVSYSVGGVLIDTFNGIQKDGVISLDVSDVINSYCRRSVSLADCVVPIEVRSSSAGVVTVLESIDKKFAVISDVPSPVIVNNTFVDETVIESTTVEIINQTIIERFTDDSFKSWFWLIIIGVPLVLFTIVMIVIKRKR